MEHSEEATREPQYQVQVRLREQYGLSPLGLATNQMWHDDPRHLVFSLARYKFVSKMLAGKQRVLEVGCGDAFGVRLIQQEVPEVTAVDFDPVFVRDARSRMSERWPFDCRVHDMLSGPLEEQFEAAYSLDVVEHIPREREGEFVRNVALSLNDQGVFIVGSPSLESQAYASEYSRAGHVNCKRGPELKQLLLEHFHNVFLFSMNDEVVHTGYSSMAHYLMAIAVTPKRN